MLAKNVNDNACFLNERGACEFFASKLAPTMGIRASLPPLITGNRWRLVPGLQHVFRAYPLVELCVREVAQLQRRLP